MTKRSKTIISPEWMSRIIAMLSLILGGCKPTAPEPQNPQQARSSEARNASAAGDLPPSYPDSFSGLSLWDDGLSEMCYYNAVDTIYGKPRHHWRMMLLNREWLNPIERVKAEHPNRETSTQQRTARPTDIPVFKLNIIEEIPTENYNYRYMVTVFLNRQSLKPEKLTASSQEWCGTTFQQMNWLSEGLKFRGFSYFEGEADRAWSLPVEPVAYPQEALFILARAVAASNRNLDLFILPEARSNHLIEPIRQEVRLVVSADRQTLRVPLGLFEVRTVELVAQSGEQLAQFSVELAPPYRLVSYRSADGKQKMSLQFVERRAYWDRSKPSGFYRQGAAP